jgi:hypothetical protein
VQICILATGFARLPGYLPGRWLGKEHIRTFFNTLLWFFVLIYRGGWESLLRHRTHSSTYLNTGWGRLSCPSQRRGAVGPYLERANHWLTSKKPGGH